MGDIIEVSGLTKSYGAIRAVDAIDFRVEEGQLFAFLGPNGAGKSTTIDMLCTFLAPDSGTVKVNGHALGAADDAIRSSIGTVFQSNLLDDLLTVAENLRTRGALYGLSGEQLRRNIERAVDATDTRDILSRRYGTLSGGQRRRVDIARALVNTPRVLFLDEPTTGLDPQTRLSVWETVRSLQRETGMTIFLTTHYMEEAAEADYVVIIDEGRIVADGTPAELKSNFARDTIKLFMADREPVLEVLSAMGIVPEIIADQAIIRVDSTLDSFPILERCLPHLIGYEVLSGTMDEAFISITGKELRS